MLVEFEIKGAGEFKAQLESIKERLADKNAMLEIVGNPIYNLTREAFEGQSSYDGTPWERLKPSTLKYKKDPRMLYDSGDLQRSLAMGMDGDEVWIGVNASSNGFQYGLSHQFSSEKRNIPARPFLPVDENGEVPQDVIDNILEMLGDYLQL